MKGGVEGIVIINSGNNAADIQIGLEYQIRSYPHIIFPFPGTVIIAAQNLRVPKLCCISSIPLSARFYR